MFTLHATAHTFLIALAPTLLLAGGLRSVDGDLLGVLIALLLLPLAAALYAIGAALLSVPYQASVRPGKFERDLGTKLYADRRLYGLCWTSLYYCKPVYHLVLSIPPLKRLVLRLFGYRGSMDFTTYPDTWLRDLPLLQLGDGAYLSNRATIGTNIVMQNGLILVDRVHVGSGAVVGHLAMVGPGCHIGAGAQIGVGAGIGIKSRIGAGAQVGPKANIEHRVSIGQGVKIGAGCFIGSGARIARGVVLPACSIVPARTVVRSSTSAYARTQDQPLWNSAA
ncbi:MAG: NDP-sugar pyrophosphorylase family protein [Candidatus Paceibacteria bacterium]|jgi:NDP-sugar pyrophosphorylase family protein